jgi:hypothetical protein
VAQEEKQTGNEKIRKQMGRSDNKWEDLTKMGRPGNKWEDLTTKGKT